MGDAGGGGAASHTHPLVAHTHDASQIYFEPNVPTGGLLSADDVQEMGEELDSEKLARSGVQPMLGDLNLDGFDIDNVRDLEVERDQTLGRDMTFLGGVGEAILSGVRRITMAGIGLIEAIRKADFSGSAVGEGIIDQPRVIHLAGDDDDSEARIDGAERIVFNDEPTKSVIENPSVVEFNVAVEAGVDTTAKRGALSYDAAERMLATWFESVDGTPRLHKIPWGWVVLQCMNGLEGQDIDEGAVVMAKGPIDPVLPHVVPYDPIDDRPDSMVDAHKVIGIAIGTAGPGDPIPIMRRGRWHYSGTFGAAFGDPVWCDGGSGLNVGTGPPGQPSARIYVGTVLEDTGSDVVIDVDVKVLPSIGELSYTQCDDPPLDYFVPVFNEANGYWTHGVLPAVGVLYSAPGGLLAQDVQHAIDELSLDQSTIALGSPAGTTQVATITIRDGDAAAIAARRHIRVYLTDDSTGTPSAAGAFASATVTTGDTLLEPTATLHFEIITDASGVAEITFDNAGGAGTYADRVVLVLPDGRLLISDALAVPNA